MFSDKNFSLTDEEYNMIADWANTHECTARYGNRRSLSCCGGEISVTFTPTTIGTCISATCICGKTFELD